MRERERTIQIRKETNHTYCYLRPKSPAPAWDTPEPGCEVELFARIKKTSKYYHQGLDDTGKAVVHKIEQMRNGSHPFRLNGNNYRGEDLTFYVKSLPGKMIKL